jgi:LPS export ABC transporter protein LptC
LASAVLASVSCGKPKHDAVAAVEAAADTADQLLIRMTHFITQDGVRKAFLEADSAWLYENAGHTDLKKVRVTFFGLAGDTSSVVTSMRGTYDTRTGRMEAIDDVVVLLSNGGRLTTSILRYDQVKNEVSTDQPYVYRGPDQNVEGPAGFVTDPSLSKFRTSRARGAGGSFTLPGQ